MNRKKRKLEFIRAKNNIRKGGSVFIRMKIAKEIANDKTESGHLIYHEGYALAKAASRKWKLKLQPVNFDMGQEGRDYEQDLVTVRYTLKHPR